MPNPLVALGGAQVGTSLIGANATENAGEDAAAASQAQVDEAARQFNLTRGDTQVARQTGNAALTDLGFLLGVRRVPTAEDITGLETELAQARADLETAQSQTAPYERSGSIYTMAGQASGRVSDDAAARTRVEDLEKKLNRSRGLMEKYSGGIGEFIKRQPGYQFGLDEGNRTLENRFSASGNPLGGKAMKAAAQFGIDYAGAKTDEHLSRLFTLAGYGPAAANTSANAGAGLTNALGSHANTVGQVAYNNAAANTGALNSALNTGVSLWNYNSSMSRPPAAGLTLAPQGPINPNIGAIA